MSEQTKLKELVRGQYKEFLLATANSLFFVFMAFFAYSPEKFLNSPWKTIYETLVPDSGLGLNLVLLLIACLYFFVFNVAAIYLAVTSIQLSKIYARVLAVIFIAIFFGFALHLFFSPSGKSDFESVGFVMDVLTWILRRGFEGFLAASMFITVYGLIQMLVLFILGNEDNKRALKMGSTIGVFVILFGVWAGYKFFAKSAVLPETIELSCANTFSIYTNYSTWPAPKYESFKDAASPYTAAKDYPIYDKDSNKTGYEWSLTTPSGWEHSASYHYVDQPESPSAYATVVVTKDAIIVNSTHETQFKKDEKDPSKNTRRESTRTITINRLSGELADISNHKTYWQNGQWGEYRYSRIGKCEKAVQKF